MSRGLERGWEKERSFRLGSLPCLPLHTRGFGSLRLREQRQPWIPGASPRYCERQDMK